MGDIPVAIPADIHSSLVLMTLVLGLITALCVFCLAFEVKFLKSDLYLKERFAEFNGNEGDKRAYLEGVRDAERTSVFGLPRPTPYQRPIRQQQECVSFPGQTCVPANVPSA